MREKQSNKSKIFFSIMLIVFLFTIIITQVYAWFTATSKYENNPTFASLEVDITSGGTSVSDSSFTTVYLNNINPGSTINFNTLSVSNTGNESVYSIIKLKLKFNANNNNYIFVYYYNLDGERVDNINIENNNTSATLLTAKQAKSVNLSFTFDGNEFANIFKQASIQVTFTALAIQSFLPEDTSGTYSSSDLYAVYYLINEVDTDTDRATYTRLDYLTTNVSSTIPYILLDYYPNQYSCCEIKYMSNSAAGWIFGARASQNNSAFGLFYNSHSSIWPIWGTQSHQQYTVQNMQNTIQVDKFVNNVFYKNGEVSKTFTNNDWQNDSVYSGHKMALFSLSSGSSVDSRHFNGRFYYMRVWENNGEKMMLIPVVDSNGTVCVYDTINQKFYYSENEGSFGYSL